MLVTLKLGQCTCIHTHTHTHSCIHLHAHRLLRGERLSQKIIYRWSFRALRIGFDFTSAAISSSALLRVHRAVGALRAPPRMHSAREILAVNYCIIVYLDCTRSPLLPCCLPARSFYPQSERSRALRACLSQKSGLMHLIEDGAALCTSVRR